MSWLIWPLIIILIAVTGLSIYRISEMSNKLTRLRRRYDYLLRGRGELNLEELIVQYGEDLDKQISEFKILASRTNQIDSRLGILEGTQEEAVESRVYEVQNQLTDRIESINADLSLSMKRLDEEVFAKMDEIEINTSQKLNIGMATVDQKIEEDYSELKGAVKSINEDVYSRFEEVNRQLSENKADMDLQMKGIREETNNTLLTMEAQINSKLQEQINEMQGQLSFAIQKIYLYRYNAFDDLVGDQSYTCVLLDEHNNGIMFTSIYGRQGCSTYSKKIKNGKPQQNISPEEEMALNGAVYIK